MGKTMFRNLFHPYCESLCKSINPEILCSVNAESNAVFSICCLNIEFFQSNDNNSGSEKNPKNQL